MQVQKAKQGYKLVKWHYGKEIEIPEDWEYEELNSKIKILSGFAFKSEFFNEEKGMPLIRIRDLSNDITETSYTGDYEEEYVVHEGDLLVGMDGEFKPYLWKGKDALLNQRVCKLTTNSKTLDQKLLYYIIGKELLHYELINVGTTVIHISKSDIEKIVIPYPPIREQQKIATILSNVDSVLQQTDKLIEKTKVLKKGLMQHLLTKGIGHSKFKKVKFLFGKEIEIPYSWDWDNITNVFEIKSGTTPSRTIPEYFSGDIPWITSTDLNRSVVNDTLERITNEAMKKSRLKLFSKGTFVIAIYGLEAAGTRGKCGILGQDSTINQACMAFIDGKNVLSLFLFYYYLAFGEKIALNLSQGTKQQNLSEDVIKFLKITIPSLEEQQKIVSIFSTIDSKINLLKNNNSNLKILKQGLEQKLLAGIIRV